MVAGLLRSEVRARRHSPVRARAAGAVRSVMETTDQRAVSATGSAAGAGYGVGRLRAWSG
jgi:hypothetical protein